MYGLKFFRRFFERNYLELNKNIDLSCCCKVGHFIKLGCKGGEGYDYSRGRSEQKAIFETYARYSRVMVKSKQKKKRS